MAAYIARRLLLIIPTLWAIITVNFFIVQVAPGGPVDQAVAEARGVDPNATLGRFSGAGQREVGTGTSTEQGAAKEPKSLYRGARGLDPEVIEAIKKRFGFDQPLHVRYWRMLKRYVLLDFGDSLFRGRSVIGLIIERMPVSISLGVWSTLITYLICIPLGMRKAVLNSSRFDLWTSTFIILTNAIPAFILAILLIIFFAGGSYLKWFPLRGLVSVNFHELSFFRRILDYCWHMTLPIIAMNIGNFATLTMLTKNSFLDEINKQYVMAARAKGLSESRILRKHVFRNAMLLVISGFPSAFIMMFFSGSLLIEVIFSLEGIGLLGFEAVMQRDYPVMFGTLYMFTLLGLVLGLVSDLTYTLVDPRIDFAKRGS